MYRANRLYSKPQGFKGNAVQEEQNKNKKMELKCKIPNKISLLRLSQALINVFLGFSVMLVIMLLF